MTEPTEEDVKRMAFEIYLITGGRRPGITNIDELHHSISMSYISQARTFFKAAAAAGFTVNKSGS